MREIMRGRVPAPPPKRSTVTGLWAFESSRGHHGWMRERSNERFAKPSAVKIASGFESPSIRQYAGMGHWLIVSLPSCSKGVRFSLPAPMLPSSTLLRMPLFQGGETGWSPVGSANLAGSFNGRTRGFESRCGCSIHSPAANFPDPSGEGSPLIRATGAVGTRVRDHSALAQQQSARLWTVRRRGSTGRQDQLPMTAGRSQVSKTSTLGFDTLHRCQLRIML